MLHRDLQFAARIDVDVLATWNDRVREERRGVREREFCAVRAEGFFTGWAVAHGLVLVYCEAGRRRHAFDFQAVELAVVGGVDGDGVCCGEGLEGKGWVVLGAPGSGVCECCCC